MALIKCPECEKEVSNSAVMCPNCGYAVREHFENIERQEQAQIANTEKERQKAVEAAARQRQLDLMYEKKAERRKKTTTALKIIIPLVAVLMICAIWIISTNVAISKRKTFDTVTAMQNYLKGDWAVKENSFAPIYRFSDTGLELLNEDGKCNRGEAVKYHPKQGYIQYGYNNDFIFLDADGSLSAGRDKYNKLFPKNKLVESGYDVLDVKLFDTVINGNTITIRGALKNSGSLYYTVGIKLKYTIYDETGNHIIDSIEQYSIHHSDVYIAPGEEVEFNDTLTSSKEIKSSYSVQVTVVEYYTKL